MKRFLLDPHVKGDPVERSVEEIVSKLRATGWVGIYAFIAEQEHSMETHPKRVGTILNYGIVQDEGVKQIFIDVECEKPDLFEGPMTARINTAAKMSRNPATGKVNIGREFCYFVTIETHCLDHIGRGTLHCLDPEMIEE
jgi:hypothetical protein